MFGSLNRQPRPPKTIASIDANQVNANQSAIPVPYMAGRQRIALNWIAPIYNQVAKKITEKTGKDTVSTVGYTYSGDVAGVLCVVHERFPLGKIFLAIFDSAIAWSGEIDRDTDFYEPITVTNFGLFRIYWGYFNQPIDSLVLAPIGALPPGVDPRDPSTWPNGDFSTQLPTDSLGHYDDHPAYRYNVLVVGQAIQFGKNRSTAPNMEFEVSRGTAWFGSGILVANDVGVNICGVIYEMMTSLVFGLGMADAELYQPGWTLTWTVAELQGFYLSPYITAQQDFKQFLAQVSQFADLWLRRRGTQWELGWWPTGLTSDQIAALPIIGTDDLTAEPDLTSDGYWDDCVTQVNVAYSDRLHYFHDDAVVVNNPGLKKQLGEDRPVYLDATKWISDAGVALQFASIYASKYGRPKISGSIAVKLEKIEAIEDAAAGAPIVGQLVKVDVASLGEEIVFRILECEFPADNENVCTLTVENERSIWPTRFMQPPPPKLGDFIVIAPAIANHRVIELPIGLKDSKAIEVAVLAQRPAPSILGFHVWTSPDNVNYDPAPLPSTFASYATLTAASGTGATMSVKFFGVDLPASQTAAQQSDYNLLVFCENEIMALGALTSLGAGVYSCNVLRGLYGTAKVSHASGVAAYFVLRDELNPIASLNFVMGGTVYFKLQPFDARQTFDLADATPFTYTFAGGLTVLVAPTVIEDYTAAPIDVGISYDDITACSIRAQAPAGQRIKYAKGSDPDQNSQYWPWYPLNHPDGMGGYIPSTDAFGNTIAGREGVGTDMLGFVQSGGVAGGGPDQTALYRFSTSWHLACAPDVGNPAVLGPVKVVTSTYKPVDQSEWPQVPTPYTYIHANESESVAQGASGYFIRVDCADASATIYISTVSASGPWTVYTPDAIVTLGAAANVYFQARRYISPGWEKYRDSDVLTFANTGQGVPNQGGPGGGGGGPSYPYQRLLQY